MTLYDSFQMAYQLLMNNETSPYQVPDSSVSEQPPVGMPPALPSKAPTVFGIIHLCYSALGLVSIALSFGGLYAIKALFSTFKANGNESEVILNAYEAVVQYTYINMAATVTFAIILLIAGIGLLKKKRWAQKLSIFWAVARIITVIVMTYLSAGVVGEFHDEVNKMSGVKNEGLEQMQASLEGAGHVLSIITVSLYPVLCLIFLSLQSTKRALK